MSETSIPKLMELNLYWQNAVKEAIRDTLRGEKRLYYALKNRKKIKKKLEKLGLKVKTLRTSSSVAGPYAFQGMKTVSHPNQSFTSVAGEFSQVVLDPEESRSRSRTRWGRRRRYPDRPLLGDGSLEKMKKSQNDFNFEAMGTCDATKMSVTDSEKEEEEEEEDTSEIGTGIPGSDREMSNKKIKWIHVREKNNFAESDSDLSQMSRATTPVKEDINKVKVDNIEGNGESNQKIPIIFDPRGDLFWENEVKNAIRAKVNFERKLQLALAKREILNEHHGIQRLEDDNQTKIRKSDAVITEKRKRGKNFLSPFVRFYLEVYRELCLKCPMNEIGEEAAKRWWNLAKKHKTFHPAKKPRK